MTAVGRQHQRAVAWRRPAVRTDQLARRCLPNAHVAAFAAGGHEPAVAGEDHAGKPFPGVRIDELALLLTGVEIELQESPDPIRNNDRTAVWREADPGLKRRLILIYSILIGFNIGVWSALILSSAKYGLLFGLAPVAYGFGLRHAVDPDHIAQHRPFAILVHGGSLSLWLRRSSSQTPT